MNQCDNCDQLMSAEDTFTVTAGDSLSAGFWVLCRACYELDTTPPVQEEER